MSANGRGAHVVVIGAGVIGLTSAITLLQKHPGTVRCTIVAECLPGDNKSIGYTSPWAGAHHVSHTKPHDKLSLRKDKETFEILLQQYHDKETDALMMIDQYEYQLEGADNGADPETLAIIGMPGFRQLSSSELPPGTVSGVYFRTLTIDTPAYLDFLHKRFLGLGGTVIRAKLQNLDEALQIPGLSSPATCIVNCTGMGALSLGGVQDQAMHPQRGQLCVIRAPWMKYGKGFTGKGNTSYTIPRSSGMVIVGGTRELDDWEDKARPETTDTILQRALAFDRNLLPPEKREIGTVKDIDLVETGCGRRPFRVGGVRIELEKTNPVGIPVLHNYGHAGFGWQSSYGYARVAEEMLRPCLVI